MNLRKIAVEVLSRYDGGGELRAELERGTEGLNPLNRAFVRETVIGVVRFRKLLDFCIKRASGRDPLRQLPEVRNALRLSLYQLLFMRVPPYAAVGETVEAVKSLLGRKFAGFVNAISRRLSTFNCRDAVMGIDDPIERLSTLYSFETWMVRRWERFYGNVEELLSGLNRNAPLFLRVNTLKVSVEKFLKLLKKSEIEFERHGFLNCMVRVKGRVDISAIPGFREGYFYIQDPASYLSAVLLSPKPGELILEVGAAPGGKTSAIAAITGNRARVIAVDVDERRIGVLRENLKRLSVDNVEVLNLDLTKGYGKLGELMGRFDRVLIDAPCSGTGVIRRHPEGKWNKSMKLIREKQKLQRKLLRASFGLLKPGGTLLYSVCSLEREEGEENMEVARETGFEYTHFDNLPKSLSAEGNTLRVFPHRNNMDGFFYALMRRGNGKR